jgi:DNA-binding MarR family transcriptional regulator
MTLYTAFDLAPESDPASDLVALDASAYRLLAVLFEADGATPDALGARMHAPREAVDGLLGALSRLGYVEREGDAAWLTGEAFGLRRAVRGAGEPIPFHNALH